MGKEDSVPRISRGSYARYIIGSGEVSWEGGSCENLDSDLTALHWTRNTLQQWDQEMQWAVAGSRRGTTP